MSILDALDDANTWAQFRQYKLDKGHLSARELGWLDTFIEAEGYRGPAQAAREGVWPLPTKRLINKLGKAKKRVVYRFPDAENWTLKLLAWLLFAYDDRQPDGCYSFRRNFGVLRALRELTALPGINNMWCYKADITNYFNSVPVPLLHPVLARVIDDDQPLFDFLMRLLSEDRALCAGDDDSDVVEEPRGVMAGTPISPFLANIYLSALDEWFVSRGVPYARYSDDIVIFANSQAELDVLRADFLRLIGEHGLHVNPDKESVSAPGIAWEFLGVSYCNGTIDLSSTTKTKLKGKIRRKARALRRWMLRKSADPEVAMRALIRVFNRKFYSLHDPNDLTWARWFFPLLTTSDGLHEIDEYLQAYVRYIPTGRFTKANYRVSYDDLKRLGYRPLVHEFYATSSVAGRE
ncbi:MAG: hypothetical protein LBM94_04915 [Propionibacteriaceae bacterium]|jgi:hypothetical protein|nr:hypothetical protein [Propionibacteriaceae bacterium]